jgi:hypothetical protein
VRRVFLRAVALAAAVLAIFAGLTFYFSSEKLPPCLVSGVPKWHPPSDNALHRFELVVPDRAICFFDMDNEHALVGSVALRGIEGITAIEMRNPASLAVRYAGARGALVDLRTGAVTTARPPRATSGAVTVPDLGRRVVYETRPNQLGFHLVDRRRRQDRFFAFEGFTWNRRFGPNPPSHGLSLAPDRTELWVLDAPNSRVHVYNVARRTPRHVADIRLTKPLSGDENPCASPRCRRIGSLQHSNDGRFVYVGDAGDVIDTATREEVTNLEALHESRLTMEVDFIRGKPVFAIPR